MKAKIQFGSYSTTFPHHVWRERDFSTITCSGKRLMCFRWLLSTLKVSFHDRQVISRMQMMGKVWQGIGMRGDGAGADRAAAAPRPRAAPQRLAHSARRRPYEYWAPPLDFPSLAALPSTTSCLSVTENFRMRKLKLGSWWLHFMIRNQQTFKDRLWFTI